MSRPRDVVFEARKAAALLHAHSGKRELLTPDQRRAGYRVAMAASFTNATNATFWRKAALSMLPFDDEV